MTLFSDYLSYQQGQSSWVETYYCGTTDGKSCNYDMHILVWGPWVKGVSGNDKAKMYSNVHIYKCVDVTGSEDEWQKVCQNCTAGNTIPECGDSQRSWGKVLTTDGYDIYMNSTQDHYDHKGDSSTRNDYTKSHAVTFGANMNDHICKKKIEKKCGRNPHIYKADRVLFCSENENSKVNAYQSKNGTWKDRTSEIVLHICENPPSGNDWQDWGRWNESLHVFSDSRSNLNGSREKGVVFKDIFETPKSVKDYRFCTWCEDVDKEPVLNEATSSYECKDAEPEQTEQPEPQPAPEPVEPPKICGVPCDGKKTIYCPNMPTANDSSVFYCPESGQNWQEIDAQAWCCNKKCTPPKTDFTDVGIWKAETGHHLYVRRGPISNGGAYNFYSEIKDDVAYGYNIEKNCTACPAGTTYSKTTQKCEQ